MWASHSILNLLFVTNQFYSALLLIYALLGSLWYWLCYTHKRDLIPLQVFLHLCFVALHLVIYQSHFSSLVGFVIIEMAANCGKHLFPETRWEKNSKASVYFNYINVYGERLTSTVFLFVGMFTLIYILAHLIQ